MPGLYLDTSAIGRLVLSEPDATAIRALLARYDAYCSSALFAVELRRLARLNEVEGEAEQIVTEVDLEPVTAGLLERASRLDPVEVRTLDAIHLATAIELRAEGRIEAVLTYDHQLQAGCKHHGIPVM